MEKAVEKYTADVVTDLKQNGATPDIVQIGNEITGGTLWPDAQVAVPLSTVKVYDATVKPIKPRSRTMTSSNGTGSAGSSAPGWPVFGKPPRRPTTFGS